MRNRAQWLGVVLLMVLTATAPAADAPAGDEGEPPSLFSPHFGTMIWTLVIFVGVVLVLGRWVWRPILDTLQRREHFIVESMESARRDREQAKTHRKELAAELAAAQDRAAEIVQEARRDAEAVARKTAEQAAEQAKTTFEEARVQLEHARDRAVQQLHDHAAELAAEVAGQILQRQMSDQDHRTLVAEAIERLDRLGDRTDRARF